MQKVQVKIKLDKGNYTGLSEIEINKMIGSNVASAMADFILTHGLVETKIEDVPKVPGSEETVKEVTALMFVEKPDNLIKLTKVIAAYRGRGNLLREFTSKIITIINS